MSDVPLENPASEAQQQAIDVLTKWHIKYETDDIFQKGSDKGLSRPEIEAQVLTKLLSANPQVRINYLYNDALLRQTRLVADLIPQRKTAAAAQGVSEAKDPVLAELGRELVAITKGIHAIKPFTISKNSSHSK